LFEKEAYNNKVENPLKNKKREAGAERSPLIDRRELLTGIAATAFATTCPRTAEALRTIPEYQSRYEKGWFYDLDGMRKVFEQEYNGDKLLRHPIQRNGKRWVGNFSGNELEIPDAFIERTTHIIQELFDKDYIQFLFRLDANHGHLFVPNDARGRYKDLTLTEEAQEMMRDPLLGILFHTAEHLEAKTDDPTQRRLTQQRNFIGWYDGRVLEALPLPNIQNSKRTAVDAPGQNLRPYPRFAAHKDGALSVVVNEEPMCFDISFNDNDYM